MKNYIVTLTTPHPLIANVKADFDTLEQAEDYVLSHLRFEGWGDGKLIQLKRQDRNQWWTWDQETDQGWLPVENEAVKKSRERLLTAVATKVQGHINGAAEYEKPTDEPTGCVESALRKTLADYHRAKAAFLFAEAERDHLLVVLEAHGNIEWPMVD